MTGKMGLFKCEGGCASTTTTAKEFGDGKGFPLIKPFKLGLWIQEMVLEFPTGFEVKEEETKKDQ